MMNRIVILALAMLASASTAQMTNWAIPASSTNSVLTVENFLKIKSLVLNQGDRMTYCQMYNNNPHYRFQAGDVFLNPDTGQANINCDTNKSDFNYIVLQSRKPWAWLYLRLNRTDASKPIVELIRGTSEETSSALVHAVLQEIEGEGKHQPNQALEATPLRGSPQRYRWHQRKRAKHEDGENNGVDGMRGVNAGRLCVDRRSQWETHGGKGAGRNV